MLPAVFANGLGRMLRPAASHSSRYSPRVNRLRPKYVPSVTDALSRCNARGTLRHRRQL
jgi:hypothetical protein